MTGFPFSAIVGQAAMKTALLLNAVDPALGGALIRGRKGTGKSTAARAFAEVLPQIEIVSDCPFHCDPEDPHPGCRERVAAGETLPRASVSTPLVELPLNATDDRLVGTLQIEDALRTGERRLEPGLLAAANRGVLYVDEVNLLEDHLVDLLLDAAASRINRVEREGISESHPAAFILVGTMNPEEGELRPQFIDRFGLCAVVEDLLEADERAQIVERRLAFERDPVAFVTTWAEAESELRDCVGGARDRLATVEVTKAALDEAVRLAMTVEAAGHRAEINLVKAARALAALMAQATADVREIREVAELVLIHRMAATPLDSVDTLRQRLAGAVRSASVPVSETPPDAVPDEADLGMAMQVPGAAAAGSRVLKLLSKKKSSTPTI